MERDEYRTSIADLLSFGTWEEATEEEKRLTTRVSGLSERDKLQREIDRIDNEPVLSSAREQLAVDVLDSDLPDAFKSGLVLALFNPISGNRQRPLFNPSAVPQEDNNITLSDYTYPDTNPINRGYQIGSTLTSLCTDLRSHRQTPAVLLSRDGRLPRNWWDKKPSLVQYFLINKDGLSITLPDRTDTGIQFPLPKPTLSGTPASAPNALRQLKPTEDATPQGIVIPHLEQLLRGAPFAAQKLIVGKGVIQFARKHHQEREAWAAHCQRIRLAEEKHRYARY